MTTKTTQLPVELPDWAEWIAQDADGAWCCFDKKPVVDDVNKLWFSKTDKYKTVYESSKVNISWRETLRRV